MHLLYINEAEHRKRSVTIQLQAFLTVTLTNPSNCLKSEWQLHVPLLYINM